MGGLILGVGEEFGEIGNDEEEVETAEDHVDEDTTEVHGCVGGVAYPEINKLKNGAHGSKSEIFEEDHHHLTIVEAVKEFTEFDGVVVRLDDGDSLPDTRVRREGRAMRRKRGASASQVSASRPPLPPPRRYCPMPRKTVQNKHVTRLSPL